MSQVYPQFVKPIDVNEVQIKLMEQMDNYRNQQYIYNEVKPILERFAGKKVTKRLITALNKELPKFHCYLRWVGSTQCYLEIKWDEKLPPYTRKGELSLFLGHIGAHSWAQKENGQGFYTMNMIEENNVWIFQIDQMIQSTLNGMKIVKDRVERWNSLLDRMKTIEKEMEKYSGLSTYFKYTN